MIALGRPTRHPAATPWSPANGNAGLRGSGGHTLAAAFANQQATSSRPRLPASLVSCDWRWRAARPASGCKNSHENNSDQAKPQILPEPYNAGPKLLAHRKASMRCFLLAAQRLKKPAGRGRGAGLARQVIYLATAQVGDESSPSVAAHRAAGRRAVGLIEALASLAQG